LFLMMAMISINLGIVNLLPFPALDGGRIVLLGYEAIFRRKLNEKVEMIINTVGFGALMLLMVLITIKDIINLF
ncbi:MAG: site-2 protease family protein, partial [Clostridia bacterium]|nr:site-2 protease family protein [Clostridia bacterium]